MNVGAGIRLDMHGHVGALTLGDIPRKTDRHVRRHPEGRACIRCRRPLSVYNPEDTCGPCDHAT